MKQKINHQKACRPAKRGFTLIELLVVISIIGILSSFAVVSLNSARNKARDALRKADMTQMRTALNLYYDENGKYPVCGAWDNNSADFGANVQDGSNCYNTTLSSALTAGAKPYLGQLPKDPKNPTNSPTTDTTYIYRYVSKSDSSEYALVYRIEDNVSLQVIRGW
ncbi:MAG: prepilin-type N-terminal cleavage/methylation domain-containing protein [Patescibacteria group bacterium]|nr:prepilin-type N-terminal cleavage/methylation domain-containing protein [Patescibacteria group bacterium]